MHAAYAERDVGDSARFFARTARSRRSLIEPAGRNGREVRRIWPHQPRRYLELSRNKHSIIVQSTTTGQTHDRPGTQAFGADRSGKTGPSRRTCHKLGPPPPPMPGTPP